MAHGGAHIEGTNYHIDITCVSGIYACNLTTYIAPDAPKTTTTTSTSGGLESAVYSSVVRASVHPPISIGHALAVDFVSVLDDFIMLCTVSPSSEWPRIRMLCRRAHIFVSPVCVLSRNCLGTWHFNMQDIYTEINY